MKAATAFTCTDEFERQQKERGVLTNIQTYLSFRLKPFSKNFFYLDLKNSYRNFPITLLYLFIASTCLYEKYFKVSLNMSVNFGTNKAPVYNIDCILYRKLGISLCLTL